MQYAAAKQGYATLWAKMHIRPERLATARAIAARLVKNRTRYEAVAAQLGMPWWWVAITHNLESGGNFSTHLHNGDSLSRRTTHVPAGRPVAGNPPFTWEASALDALRLKNMQAVGNWEIPRALYEFERYNGFGYVQHRVNSPYVWSFSEFYQKGKYYADGKYIASMVSEQCGAAVLLKCILDLGEGADHMGELVSFLKPFERGVPAIARSIAGGAPDLAVKALAEAAGSGVEATPQAVHQALMGLPLTGIVDVLAKAEAVLNAVLGPDETPAPAPEVPASPPPSKIDEMTGFTGWKTVIGIGLYVLVNGAAALGVVPILLTPDIVGAMNALITGIIGVGLVAKVDRYLGWLMVLRR